MKIEDIKNFIRDIPDFPKKGIIFRDITPLLKNSEAFKIAIDGMAEQLKTLNIHKIVSMEARGFIFGSVLSYKLNCGFIPVRKKGKLPYDTINIEYELEYGKDILEIHKDAINVGDNVVVVDDVLATGGTAYAVSKLVEKSGGKVIGLSFLIELTYLEPREKLKEYNIFSLIKY